MKSTPKGWPRISGSVFYDDPRKAIDFLCTAFGFEVRLLVDGEGGSVVHSELTYGEGLIMVGQAGATKHRPKAEWRKSPREAGGCTGALMVFVDDADAHCAHARAHGAIIDAEPETHDYGKEYWADRSYGAVDPEGHYWWFTQRVRSPEEG